MKDIKIINTINLTPNIQRQKVKKNRTKVKKGMDFFL